MRDKEIRNKEIGNKEIGNKETSPDVGALVR